MAEPIGIFSGAFDNAAPARIAHDVQHRCEGPFDADSACFFGGDRLRFCSGGRIPRRGHGNRHGEDGPEAVDDVETEDERNVQASVLDREMLETIDFRGIRDEEK